MSRRGGAAIVRQARREAKRAQIKADNAVLWTVGDMSSGVYCSLWGPMTLRKAKNLINRKRVQGAIYQRRRCDNEGSRSVGES